MVWNQERGDKKKIKNQGESRKIEIWSQKLQDQRNRVLSSPEPRIRIHREKNTGFGIWKEKEKDSRKASEMRPGGTEGHSRIGVPQRYDSTNLSLGIKDLAVTLGFNPQRLEWGDTRQPKPYDFMISLLPCADYESQQKFISNITSADLHMCTSPHKNQKSIPPGDLVSWNGAFFLQRSAKNYK